MSSRPRSGRGGVSENQRPGSRWRGVGHGLPRGRHRSYENTGPQYNPQYDMYEYQGRQPWYEQTYCWQPPSGRNGGQPRSHRSQRNGQYSLQSRPYQHGQYTRHQQHEYEYMQAFYSCQNGQQFLSPQHFRQQGPAINPECVQYETPFHQNAGGVEGGSAGRRGQRGQGRGSNQRGMIYGRGGKQRGNRGGRRGGSQRQDFDRGEQEGGHRGGRSQMQDFDRGGQEQGNRGGRRGICHKVNFEASFSGEDRSVSSERGKSMREYDITQQNGKKSQQDFRNVTIKKSMERCERSVKDESAESLNPRQQTGRQRRRQKRRQQRRKPDIKHTSSSPPAKQEEKVVESNLQNQIKASESLTDKNAVNPVCIDDDNTKQALHNSEQSVHLAKNKKHTVTAYYNTTGRFRKFGKGKPSKRPPTTTSCSEINNMVEQLTVTYLEETHNLGEIGSLLEELENVSKKYGTAHAENILMVCEEEEYKVEERKLVEEEDDVNSPREETQGIQPFGTSSKDLGSVVESDRCVIRSSEEGMVNIEAPMFVENVGDDDVDVQEAFRTLLTEFGGRASMPHLLKRRMLLPASLLNHAWLDRQKNKFMIFEKNGSVEYVSVIFNGTQLCVYYNGPNGCTKKECEYFHVCTGFVTKICKPNTHSCARSHNFHDRQNAAVVAKHGLDKYKNKEIAKIIRCSFPEVCREYNQGLPHDEETCPYLHMCDKYPCSVSSSCKMEHKYHSTKHNRWVLECFNVGHFKEHKLAQMILGRKIYVNTDSIITDDAPNKKGSRDDAIDPLPNISKSTAHPAPQSMKKLTIHEAPIQSTADLKEDSRAKTTSCLSPREDGNADGQTTNTIPITPEALCISQQANYNTIASAETSFPVSHPIEPGSTSEPDTCMTADSPLPLGTTHCSDESNINRLPRGSQDGDTTVLVSSQPSLENETPWSSLEHEKNYLMQSPPKTTVSTAGWQSLGICFHKKMEGLETHVQGCLDRNFTDTRDSSKVSRPEARFPPPSSSLNYHEADIVSTMPSIQRDQCSQPGKTTGFPLSSSEQTQSQHLTAFSLPATEVSLPSLTQGYYRVSPSTIVSGHRHLQSAHRYSTAEPAFDLPETRFPPQPSTNLSYSTTPLAPLPGKQHMSHSQLQTLKPYHLPETGFQQPPSNLRSNSPLTMCHIPTESALSMTDTQMKKDLQSMATKAEATHVIATSANPPTAPNRSEHGTEPSGLSKQSYRNTQNYQRI